MDDKHLFSRADWILKIAIWFGVGMLAIVVADMLLLDNTLLTQLFNAK